jgi:hypothetical protein
MPSFPGSAGQRVSSKLCFAFKSFRAAMPSALPVELPERSRIRTTRLGDSATLIHIPIPIRGIIAFFARRIDQRTSPTETFAVAAKKRRRLAEAISQIVRCL